MQTNNLRRGPLAASKRQSFYKETFMGIPVGKSQGATVSDPNIVPLIDVLLVLIIIFMVIAPKVPTGLPALIPQPAPPQWKPEPIEPRTIVVQVMQGGKLMINQEQSDWNVVGRRLSDISKSALTRWLSSKVPKKSRSLRLRARLT